jgi:antitoxin (DNA-binding transcriptional repressor) of toxin-antitoxin stability system
MSISSLVRRVVPAATAFVTSVGNPVATFAAVAQNERALRDEKRIKRRIEEQRSLENERAELMYYDQRGGGFVNTNIGASATSNSGFGAQVGSFFRDVGSNIVRPLSELYGSVRGFMRPQEAQRQPALTTVTNVGAQESSRSGTNEAFIGGLPNIIGTASRFLRSPVGQIGTGLGVGTALMSAPGTIPRMRITRKTKRLAQQAFNIAGGNLSNAVVIFAQLTGMQVSEGEFVIILTKRFRNDGAVVTKAALRKTKSTIRKLKGMCDMYDSLRPTARRRTTTSMKRANVSLIKN